MKTVPKRKKKSNVKLLVFSAIVICGLIFSSLGFLFVKGLVIRAQACTTGHCNACEKANGVCQFNNPSCPPGYSVSSLRCTTPSFSGFTCCTPN